MLPLKLTFKGLYSYQQEQVIDFTKLVDGRLFGIFGAVGSGKSTILEAISFALYGETERLNLRDNRAYNMMNLKCGDLYIDFIFTTGDQRDTYRCVVFCKRHKSIFDKIQSLERKAYRSVDGEWIPIEVSEIPEIIGLSYDNFRRTIIIPQGKFSEFLQLGDKDRTQMLKEIFHLERFEYSFQVSALEKRNTERVNHVQGQLDQIGEINLEEIEEYKNDLNGLIEESEKLRAVLDEKVQLEKLLSKLKDLFLKLHTQRKELDKLEALRESYKEQEVRIDDYEYCLINFKSVVENQGDVKVKINSTKGDLANLQNQSSTVQKALSFQEIDLKSIQPQFQEREQLRAKAEELRKIISIFNLKSEIDNLQLRVKKGNDLLISGNATIDILQKERDTIKSSLSAKKSSLPDLGRLNEISKWIAIKNNIEGNIKSISSEIGGLEPSLAQLISTSAAALPREVKQFIGEDGLPIQELIGFLVKRKGQLQVDQESLTHEIEHLAIQSGLETYAKTLVENEPCPLCGSIHHPDVLSITNVNTKLKNLRDKRVEVGNALRKLDEVIASEQTRNIKIENIKDQISKENQRLLQEDEKLKEHYSKFIWEEFDSQNAERVEASINEAKKLNEEIAGHEKVLEGKLKELDKELANKEKYTSGVNQLNLQLANKLSEQNTYKSQLSLIKLEDCAALSSDVADRQIRELEEKYTFLGKRFDQLQQSVNGLKIEFAKLEGQTNEAEKKLLDLQETLTQINEALKVALASSEFKSLEEVESILKQKINILEGKDRIQQYYKTLHSLSDQHEVLVKEIEGRSYNPEEHGVLIATINDQKILVDKASEEIGRIKSEIEQREKNLKERELLIQELGQLQLRREDLNTLKQLFKGSGFVNYVSSVFLQNLCNSANERFYKLTRQKLRLELTENNNFQVRDFLNNGQVRSVKTLSGGQTFQAALSLSLSLAESIQQQNKSKQNFFFLDEGFGSQDKESLQVVFETLKSLRREDRIVGIISHVNELQQEIDVYLNVENDEEKGSLVVGSWER